MTKEQLELYREAIIRFPVGIERNVAHYPRRHTITTNHDIHKELFIETDKNLHVNLGCSLSEDDLSSSSVYSSKDGWSKCFISEDSIFETDTKELSDKVFRFLDLNGYNCCYGYTWTPAWRYVIFNKRSQTWELKSKDHLPKPISEYKYIYKASDMFPEVDIPEMEEIERNPATSEVTPEPDFHKPKLNKSFVEQCYFVVNNQEEFIKLMEVLRDNYELELSSDWIQYSVTDEWKYVRKSQFSSLYVLDHSAPADSDTIKHYKILAKDFLDLLSDKNPKANMFYPVVIDGIQFVHDTPISCYIKDTEIREAKVSINKSGDVYICQNFKNGNAADDRLGYRYSWSLFGGLKYNEVRIIEYQGIKHVKEYPLTPVEAKKVPDTKYQDLSMLKHGDIVSCNLRGHVLIGIVSIEAHSIFICQDILKGASCKEKFGYKYSYQIDTAKTETLKEIFTLYDILGNEFDKSCEDNSDHNSILTDFTQYTSDSIPDNADYSKYLLPLQIEEPEVKVVKVTKSNINYSII